MNYFMDELRPCATHAKTTQPTWISGVLASILFLIGSPVLGASNASQLPDGPGKATVQKICSGCHAAEIVLGRRDTREGWEQLVSNMVDKGANGTDDEFNTVIDYLAAHFPKNTDSKSTGSASSGKNN
ncbi:MAG: cytochrome c [Acidobacteriota bacterium]|nr:cytochrome c [Acidobacteriota bacterium]